MNKLPTTKAFKNLDEDLKELVSLALPFPATKYLKIYMMAVISQDLRELRRTFMDLHPET